MVEKYSELKDSLQIVNETQEGISKREKRINIIGHEILIINDNPEIDFEVYTVKVEQTLNKISLIHPKITSSIKKIILSDIGKEKIKEVNIERDIKEGLINGPNGEKYNGEIVLKARAFKEDIVARYISDNTDIHSSSPLGHFEFILAHECFHDLENLNQFQKEDKTDPNNFIWMKHANNEKSILFNGFLKSKNFDIFFDENGNLRENYVSAGAEIKYINDEENKPVKCFFNSNSKVIIPEKTIFFPERMLTNYSRNQSKHNTEEDFCDSMVLYTFDPEFLIQFDKLHGTKKFELLDERWGFYSKKIG
jgi:hypothetical protein